MAAATISAVLLALLLAQAAFMLFPSDDSSMPLPLPEANRTSQLVWSLEWLGLATVISLLIVGAFLIVTRKRRKQDYTGGGVSECNFPPVAQFCWGISKIAMWIAWRGIPVVSKTLVIPSTTFFLFSALIPAQIETCTKGTKITNKKDVQSQINFSKSSLFNI